MAERNMNLDIKSDDLNIAPYPMGEKLVLPDASPKLQFIRMKRVPRKLLSKTLLPFGKHVVGTLFKMTISSTPKASWDGRVLTMKFSLGLE